MCEQMGNIEKAKAGKSRAKGQSSSVAEMRVFAAEAGIPINE